MAEDKTNTLDGEIVSPKCAFKAADRAFRGAWRDAFNQMSLIRQPRRAPRGGS